MKGVCFTLNVRPFYTRQVLKLWSQVRGIEEWRWCFFIEPTTQTESQIKVAAEFLAKNRLMGEIHVNKNRLGCAGNTHAVLDYAFKRGFDRAVLAEEDVAPAADVLEWFDWAACRRPHITCAHTTEDGPVNEATYRKWFNPWLWQTDRRAWYDHLRDTWDFDYSQGGFDANIGHNLVNERNLKILFPAGGSRSAHIGKHMGTHQAPELHGETEVPPSFEPEREPVEWRLA
jgi:hypothetical protein